MTFNNKTKKNPLVSIIVPSYNRKHAIERPITSIIKQDYQNWELIIIDDNSVDGTIDFIHSNFSSDSRISIYQNKYSRGVSTARNYGLELAKGKYISFLDSDDSWYPYHLSDCLYALESFNLDICLGIWHENIDGNTIKSFKWQQALNESLSQIQPNKVEHYYLVSKKFFEFVLFHNHHIFHINSLILSRQFLKKYKIRFDNRLLTNEDNDFIIKSISKGKSAISVLPQFIYYQGTDNLYFFKGFNCKTDSEIKKRVNRHLRSYLLYLKFKRKYIAKMVPNGTAKVINKLLWIQRAYTSLELANLNKANTTKSILYRSKYFFSYIFSFIIKLDFNYKTRFEYYLVLWRITQLNRDKRKLITSLSGIFKDIFINITIFISNKRTFSISVLKQNLNATKNLSLHFLIIDLTNNIEIKKAVSDLNFEFKNLTYKKIKSDQFTFISYINILQEVGLPYLIYHIRPTDYISNDINMYLYFNLRNFDYLYLHPNQREKLFRFKGENSELSWFDIITYWSTNTYLLKNYQKEFWHIIKNDIMEQGSELLFGKPIDNNRIFYEGMFVSNYNF